MSSLFNVVYISEYSKKGNLSSESHSSVKSTKFFPIYFFNNKEMIFKPMSKTKPLTTPFFSYSEVYWSYVINKYFDSKAPRYYLSVGKEEDLEEKYYNKGVLVKKINNDNQRLFNLYDYFIEHPQDDIDISNYCNYCMKTYDYSQILSSKFISDNSDIGRDISYQILLSILRMDQNFHYENVNFLEEDGKIEVAPPIDFEFSNFFLYPDDISRYEYEKQKYTNDIAIPEQEEPDKDLFKKLCEQIGMDFITYNKKNISCIVKKYPDVVMKFIGNLDKFINELKDIKLEDEFNYIGKMNSDYWTVYYSLYKENDSDKYNQLKNSMKLHDIDKEETFNKITSDIYEFAVKFRSTLRTYLFAHQKGIQNLEELTLKDLLNVISKEDSEEIKKLDLDNLSLILKK